MAKTFLVIAPEESSDYQFFARYHLGKTYSGVVGIDPAGIIVATPNGEQRVERITDYTDIFIHTDHVDLAIGVERREEILDYITSHAGVDVLRHYTHEGSARLSSLWRRKPAVQS